MTTASDSARQPSRAARPATRVAGSTRAEAAGRLPLLARPLTSYYLILGSALLLAAIGLLMVLSASSVRSYSASGSSFTVFQRQLLWVVIGVPAMWVAVRLPVRTIRLLAVPMMLVAIVGLVLVFVPGIGAKEVDGARRWILIGPVRAQPSEFAKLALALWGADLFTRKQKLLSDTTHLLVPLVPACLLLAALIMAEPDLGTTLVVVGIAFALLYVAGAPRRLFALLCGVGLVGVSVLAVTAPYRLRRITAFLDPWADPLHSGYQTIQGLYAIASGGWFGVGLGQSRQKWTYLPNAHTDFVFAIIGEELGLVGTLFVLALFGMLAYAGIRIAQRTRDPFIRLASAAITAWLLGQALINIGAVTGLLPITGIPLPLISFGGSSLGVSLFAIGLLAAFARCEPGAREALAARGPSRVARGRRAFAAYYGFGPAPRQAAARPAQQRARAARGSARP